MCERLGHDDVFIKAWSIQSGCRVAVALLLVAPSI
jgi:hypothetical protein